ncbi:hypothetical protein QVD17_06908 [Tagetes erecta]|uniref:Uncharacterized protein n=1 Tax=Tagetes erecta TaxID=13708 RepID=A0AAD8LLK0_TARER|nr:hypothetical protein QVD17_06908 [Tagetes erecta]
MMMIGDDDGWWAPEMIVVDDDVEHGRRWVGVNGGWETSEKAERMGSYETVVVIVVRGGGRWGWMPEMC